jgi:transforming growth factor-beta-induced protein
MVPQVTQMLSTARDITILAPSNEAFSKLMRENPNFANMAKNPATVTALLQYHVINGMMMSNMFTATPKFATTMLMMPSANVTGGQKVELVNTNGMAMILSGFKQSSMVSMADIMFDGGVVHVVDTVLTIPASPAITAVDTGLTAIAGALTKAQLVNAVNSMRDITIFAPSNAGFEAVGSAANALSVQDLGRVLEYHVLMNQVKFSTDLMMMQEGMTMEFTTLIGDKLFVRMENGQLFVNSAKVVISDIITSNGVVHVIDK